MANVPNKVFDRVLIVMFENQYRSYVTQDPFMQKLAMAGASMNNYFGCFHPSQTNYLASIAGEICGVTNDIPPAKPLEQKNLVDVLEQGEVLWKAYMEGYPGDPWKPAWKTGDYPTADQPINDYPLPGDAQLSRYFRKHNAFASFKSVQASEQRWQKIVSDEQFWRDVNSDALPEYSWFTPDIWNDGHYLYNTHIDTNPRTLLVPQMSAWLQYVFFGNLPSSKLQGATASGQTNVGLGLDIDKLIEDPAAAWVASNIPSGTLIVVTFDEADYDATNFDTNYDGPNQIFTVLLGDMIEPGTQIDTPYNHYSLIKTVQRNFGLETLGKNDEQANSFRFLWGEAFEWSEPSTLAMQSCGGFALANLSGTTEMVLHDREGNLLSTQIGETGGCGTPTYTGVTGAGDALALASCDEALLLAYAQADGIYVTARGSDGDWATPTLLQGGALLQPGQKAPVAGQVAITGYTDNADGTNKAMLCWRTASGFIQYAIYKGGQWGEVGDVKQLTDGPMALGQMGPSLYLMYKERNTRKMRLTSFNLAPFNAFDALDFDDKPAPANSTSLHQWAPADFHVGNFAKKMGALQNDYQSQGNMAVASIEGEMHFVHRAGYEDMSYAYAEVFGLTGVFTAADQWSNGDGTLYQAGWTKEEKLADVTLDVDSPMAMSSDGQTLTLVWRAKGNAAPLMVRTGSYRPQQ